MAVLIVLALLSSSSPVAANNALEAGDYPTAVQLYLDFLEQEPDSYEARFGLGRALAFGRDWDDALTVFTGLLIDNPEDGDVRLARGRLLGWMERYAEAEKDLGQVTMLYPDYGDAWAALGDLYMWTDRPQSAVDAYTHWVELDGDNPDPYLKRARAYREARLFTQARFDLERAAGRGANPGLIARERTAIDRAPIEGAWEIGGWYDYVGYGEGRADWHTGRVTILRELERASVMLETIVAARFEKVDEALALESYVHLWPGAYGNLRAQLTPRAQVLPTWDLRAAIFQGFAHIFEVGASYRFMDFADNNVNILGVTLSAYVGDWFLQLDTSLVPDEGKLGFNVGALVRFYYDTVDDLLELRGGIGRQVVLLAPGIVEIRNGGFVLFRGQRFFTRHFGTHVSLSITADEDVPLGFGAGLGLLFRF